MLRSLYTNIVLLAICIAALVVLITFYLLYKEAPQETTVSPQETQKASTIIEDPSKIDSVSYKKYMDMKEGKNLFKESGCPNCHEVCSKKIGPALGGVSNRRKKEWIYQAVHNFPLLLEKGDKDAQILFSEFKTQMPQHPFLKNNDIDKILCFIDHDNCNESK